MTQKHPIEPLLRKFIRNECTVEEAEKVIAYFQKAKDSANIPSIEEVREMVGELPRMESDTADKIYRDILFKSRQKRFPFAKGILKYAAAAAILVGLLSTAYLFLNKAPDAVEKQLVIPANDAITLELEDGRIEVLKQNSNTEVVGADGRIIGQQNGRELDHTKVKNASKIVYNTLTVPYGKRFNLLLSDGSKVFLNAGTKLKYPVPFARGQNRQVFLTGEAFFEVAKDKEHPFIVTANDLDVEVLGTEFNVSNYPEDKSTDVVLVEGSVSLSESRTSADKESSTVLVPGLKGSFDRGNSAIRTQKVNTKTYTSWVRGELVFRNMLFDNILKKLERHYNVTIYNYNKALGGEVFNAGFSDYSINEVLESLSKNYGIDYVIENNTVIIK